MNGQWQTYTIFIPTMVCVRDIDMKYSSSIILIVTQMRGVCSTHAKTEYSLQIDGNLLMVDSFKKDLTFCLTVSIDQQEKGSRAL